MLRSASLVSLLLLGLALGVSYSHLLQLAPKATLPASDFLTIHQVLLSQYGIGIGWIEGLAAISLGFVSFLARHNKQYLRLTLISLLCVAAMIIIWAIWIRPINAAVDSWTTVSLPDNWQNARNAWHTFHAIRFILAVVAFGTFAWAVTSKRSSDRKLVELSD